MTLIRLSTLILAAAILSACGGNTALNNDRKANAVAPTATSNSSVPAANVQTAATPSNPSASNAMPVKSPVQPTNSNGAVAPERPRVVDEKKAAKSAPKPSNSIPSDDEMKKAFAKPVTKEDVNNPGMRKSEPMMKSKGNEVPMMKSTRKPSDKP